MNANSLAYLPSLGTFQMKEVHRREVLKNGEEVWQLVQASEEARGLDIGQ